MNRLTKDLHNQYKDYWYRKDLEQVCDKEQIVLTKLGMLEDIEEEHGIDLITLFKALIGIWVKSTNGDVYYVGSPYLCFSENEKRELEFQFRVGDTWYKIKDYGKTWAVNKKVFAKDELKNDR